MAADHSRWFENITPPYDFWSAAARLATFAVSLKVSAVYERRRACLSPVKSRWLLCNVWVFSGTYRRLWGLSEVSQLPAGRSNA